MFSCAGPCPPNPGLSCLEQVPCILLPEGEEAERGGPPGNPRPHPGMLGQLQSPGWVRVMGGPWAAPSG